MSDISFTFVDGNFTPEELESIQKDLKENGNGLSEEAYMEFVEKDRIFVENYIPEIEPHPLTKRQYLQMQVHRTKLEEAGITHYCEK